MSDTEVTKQATTAKVISVLLIEDDKAISSMYQRRFDFEGGFNITIANNGQEGLNDLKTLNPDVILLDMMMPVMSGLETLKLIRQLPNGKSLKIIALTNMNDSDTSQTIVDLGVTDHIIKANTTPGVIVEKVRELASR